VKQLGVGFRQAWADFYSYFPFADLQMWKRAVLDIVDELRGAH
jgi:hypothetical protein